MTAIAAPQLGGHGIDPCYLPSGSPHCEERLTRAHRHAISDFNRPDRTVIAVEDRRQMMTDIYRRLARQGITYVSVGRGSSLMRLQRPGEV